MTAADLDFIHDDDPTPAPLGLAPEPVEVRRNGGLAAAVGALASAVAIAYLARATSTGAVLDWLLVGLMGLIGAGYLLSFVDARMPLLVADVQGVRIRLGRSWRGVPWAALDRVEHRPRRGLLRDGRLVLVAQNEDKVLEDLDRSGRRQTRAARRLYGAPLAIPLALTTRVTGADDDLTGALARLAGDPGRVVEVVPEPEPEPEQVEHEAHEEVAEPEAPVEEVHHDAEVDVDDRLDESEDAEDAQDHHSRIPDPRPALARGISYLAGRLPVAGARAEVQLDRHEEPVEETETTARELRRPGSVSLVEDTVVWSDRVRPIAREGAAVEPLVIDDFEVQPADDPVIGPELSAARTRLGLSVDQLAERTRIRPHVIESIEVDDFAPCGGDFYARGHLRTLARVLGIDVTPLLAEYDERYADAPIDARRVFEAELATGAGGPIRGTQGGLNWSVLVAAVMAVVLAWSIARLVMDSPVDLHSRPVLNGSPSSTTKLGPPVPVVLDASHGGAHVVVRDGSGDVAFLGDLAYGDTKTLKVVPPVRVQSSDGSLRVTLDGQQRGPLGATGQPAQNTFAAPE